MKKTSTTKKTHYEILELKRDVSKSNIKKAYRRLALKYHPDRSSEPDAEDRMKEINIAYEILSDPEKRASYDRTLPPEVIRKEPQAPKRPESKRSSTTDDAEHYHTNSRYTASNVYGFGAEYGYSTGFDPFRYARERSPDNKSVVLTGGRFSMTIVTMAKRGRRPSLTDTMSNLVLRFLYPDCKRSDRGATCRESTFHIRITSKA